MTDKKENPLAHVTGTEGYVSESVTVKKGMTNDGLVTNGQKTGAQAQPKTTFSSPVAPSFGSTPPKSDGK